MKDYEPEAMETREVFGITLEQQRNTMVLNLDLLRNIPTSNRTLPESAKQDLPEQVNAIDQFLRNDVTLAEREQI